MSCTELSPQTFSALGIAGFGSHIDALKVFHQSLRKSERDIKSPRVHIVYLQSRLRMLEGTLKTAENIDADTNSARIIYCGINTDKKLFLPLICDQIHNLLKGFSAQEPHAAIC